MTTAESKNNTLSERLLIWAVNLLLLILISMVGYNNNQQSMRIASVEKDLNASQRDVVELRAWKEAYKGDHDMLMTLNSDFHSSTETLRGFTGLLREAKDMITALSAQQIALREIVLHLDQQVSQPVRRR